jgi:uncharacterized membrane protein (UPF0136 family)
MLHDTCSASLLCMQSWHGIHAACSVYAWLLACLPNNSMSCTAFKELPFILTALLPVLCCHHTLHTGQQQ